MNTQELFEGEIRDLYDAEKQITKALPRMAKAADNEELKEAFQHHLDQTQEQILRLEQIFGMLGIAARGKPCKGMRGLIEEGKEHMEEHERGPDKDAAMISAAQRVEHYEMAAYGTARALAQKLGHDEAVGLLQQTADEEGDTDKLLTEISLRLLEESAEGEGDVEEEREKLEVRRAASSARPGAKAKGSSRRRAS